MKKSILSLFTAVALTLLFSCEGSDDAGYTNAGLDEAEISHAQKLIDSSLLKLQKELYKADTIAIGELKREINLLKEDIKKLKK